MSYAVWGEDSDVYVYLHCDGFLLCCCGHEGLGYRAYTTQEMIDHLKGHQAKGDAVPDYAFKGLEEDRVANDEFIRAYNAGEDVDKL